MLDFVGRKERKIRKKVVRKNEMEGKDMKKAKKCVNMKERRKMAKEIEKRTL